MIRLPFGSIGAPPIFRGFEPGCYQALAEKLSQICPVDSVVTWATQKSLEMTGLFFFFWGDLWGFELKHEKGHD